MGVVGHLDTCSSSLARRSRAKVRSEADFLASSSNSAMRRRARSRLEVRGECGELKVGLVSDRADLLRMAGKVWVPVGLPDIFLGRSMRASVLALMVLLVLMLVASVMV